VQTQRAPHVAVGQPDAQPVGAVPAIADVRRRLVPMRRRPKRHRLGCRESARLIEFAPVEVPTAFQTDGPDCSRGVERRSSMPSSANGAAACIVVAALVRIRASGDNQVWITPGHRLYAYAERLARNQNLQIHPLLYPPMFTALRQDEPLQPLQQQVMTLAGEHQLVMNERQRNPSEAASETGRPTQDSRCACSSCRLGHHLCGLCLYGLPVQGDGASGYRHCLAHAASGG